MLTKERTMKTLENFLKQKNHWNSFFKGPQYTLNSAADRQAVADMIDSALSPENLTSGSYFLSCLAAVINSL